MNRFRKIPKKIIAAVLIGIVILFWIFRPKGTAALDTVAVKKSDLIKSISVSGSIIAKKSADLSFATSGKLVYLAVVKGDHIESGQTIAMQDSRTVQKNLEAVLIDYSKQRNTFDQTKENNQNRTPSEALNDQMKRVLENNQYDLNKAVISVELQDLAREQSVLVSPISGIITRADAKSTGVLAGQSTIFTVTDPSSLVFSLDIDEADIGKVEVGNKVNVTLDAFSNNQFESSISSIDFIAHTTSTGGNAYTAEVNLPSLLNYRVGMNGNAEIILDKKISTLTIPLSSIFDGNKVFVRTKNGNIRTKTVTLGLQNDTEAEVLSGLLQDDEILTQPSLAPKPSQSFFRLPFLRGITGRR